MNKLLLIKVVFMLLLSGAVQAQMKSRPTDADTAYQRYQWEIGGDALWLFKKNTVPIGADPLWSFKKNTIPLSFHLRQHNKEKLSAIRLRIGFSLNQNLNPLSGGLSTQNNTAYDKTELRLFTSIGKEWQKHYGPFRFLYGGDVFVRYSRNNYVRTDTFFQGYNAALIAGLSPFIGGQFFIHPRISFSTETHLDIGYNQFKSLRLVGNDINNPRSLHNNKYIRADFNPFYVLNTSFHF